MKFNEGIGKKEEGIAFIKRVGKDHKDLFSQLLSAITTIKTFEQDKDNFEVIDRFFIRSFCKYIDLAPILLTDEGVIYFATRHDYIEISYDDIKKKYNISIKELFDEDRKEEMFDSLVSIGISEILDNPNIFQKWFDDNYERVCDGLQEAKNIDKKKLINISRNLIEEIIKHNASTIFSYKNKEYFYKLTNYINIETKDN